MTEGGDDRPWERPGAARRDCEPRPPLRPTLMRFLVTAFSACAASSLYLLAWGATQGALAPWAGSVVAFLGLPLSAATWVIAKGDLEKMRVNLMDAKGHTAAANAVRYARVGVVLCALLCVANGVVGVWKLLA